MWNEREAYFFIVSHAFICIRKQKQTKLDSFSFGTALSFYLFLFPCCCFVVVFFQSRLYSSSSARLCVVQNIFGGSLPRASPPMLAALDVFALKRDLTVCGKVTHAALIRAAKRIREIQELFFPLQRVLRVLRKGRKFTDVSRCRRADIQRRRLQFDTSTVSVCACVCACARLCVRPPSVMRHKVCLSAPTRCFSASSTGSAEPRRLGGLKKRAVPPPFSGSACGSRRAAAGSRKLCQSSSSFIGCFFLGWPFL